MRFFSSADRDTDIAPGSIVQIEHPDLDPQKFPAAVAVTRPADTEPPNNTERWVWVRYTNGDVGPVRHELVRVVAEPTTADECAADCPAPGLIPLDDAGLYEFVRATPRSQRWLVASWLKFQEGRDGWDTSVDRITEQVINEEQITEARAALRKKLAAAVQAIRDATSTYTALATDLYDVEYAEGGFLFTHYLEAADLALRTAVAVNPCRDEKD